MKVDNEKEKLYYDTYQPEELEEITNTQRKIIHYIKEQKMKKLHSILIIVDDFADDLKFVGYGIFIFGLFEFIISYVYWFYYWNICHN